MKKVIKILNEQKDMYDRQLMLVLDEKGRVSNLNERGYINVKIDGSGLFVRDEKDLLYDVDGNQVTEGKEYELYEEHLKTTLQEIATALMIVSVGE